MRATRSALSTWWLAVCLACSTAGPAVERSPADRAGTGTPASAALPPLTHPIGGYTIRGRLAEPVLTWRCEPDGGPFAAEVLEAAARVAADGWNATGLVRLDAAPAGRPADVVVSWHGTERRPGCVPFGRDRSPAHTTSMADRPMAIHLDATRPWDLAAGGRGEWLAGALLHEFGHTLGLDHSSDPLALMFADTHASAPGPADRAGLAALYGPGPARLGDLILVRPEGGGRVVLPGAAPEGTDWALFDVDGDGADEVLVWELGGLGALMIHHLEAGPHGPRLSATRGPALGAFPPGASHRLWRSADGRPWLVSRHDESTWSVLAFVADGELVRAEPLDHIAVLAELGASPAAPVRRRSGDVDGDGRVERMEALRGEGGGPATPAAGR